MSDSVNPHHDDNWTAAGVTGMFDSAQLKRTRRRHLWLTLIAVCVVATALLIPLNLAWQQVQISKLQTLTEQYPPRDTHESGDGLFGDACVLFVIHFQMGVLIPWRVVAIEAWASDLDESDTRLNESPCSQGLGCIEPLMLVRGVHTVHLLDMFRFTADVRDLGHRTLHPESSLVIRDGGLDGLRIGCLCAKGRIRLG